MALEFSGDCLLLGHILLNTNEMGDCSIGIPNRGDPGMVNCDPAIAAPVEKFAFPALASLKRYFQALPSRVWRRVSAQNTGRLPDDLFLEKAGCSAEGVIDIDDPRLRIGNDDAVRVLGQGLGLYAQTFFRRQPFGNVAGQDDVKALAIECQQADMQLDRELAPVLASLTTAGQVGCVRFKGSQDRLGIGEFPFGLEIEHAHGQQLGPGITETVAGPLIHLQQLAGMVVHKQRIRCGLVEQFRECPVSCLQA